MHRTMRMLVLLFALALVAAACGGDDGGDGGTTTTNGNGNGDGGAATTSVEMQDFAFEPSTLTVASGDTVDLENTGQAPHTFTLTDTDVDVEVAPGETGSATIDADPGDYELVCRFHPQMTGTVTVE